MKEFFTYLKSKIFLKNLAIAIGVAFGIIILLLIFLNLYTHHKRSIAVPDFTEVPYQVAAEQITERDLRYVIFDSVFVADMDGGVVVDQHPKPGKLVKKNRKVYLTINASSPEKIPMPNLVGITLREARTKIGVAGLNLGTLRYRYDMAKNVVLEQEIRGEKINAGDTIPKGSSIDLVLGKGLSDEKTSVPDLVGLSYEIAQAKANDAFFTTSEPIEDLTIAENDTLTPFIYRQHPVPSQTNLVPLGTQITVWVTVDSTKVPAFVKKDSTDTESVWPGLNNSDDVEILDDEDNNDYGSVY